MRLLNTNKMTNEVAKHKSNAIEPANNNNNKNEAAKQENDGK